MQIDQFLPEYDFHERHERLISATPLQAYPICKQLDVRDSAIIAILLRIRGIHVDEHHLVTDSFTVFYENAPFEIVWGGIGRPWKLFEKPARIDAGEFQLFEKTGFAKFVWSFTFQQRDGNTLVTTETRVKCTDACSRWKFRIYWILIRPFSGLIRREMLRLIDKKSVSALK